MKEYYINPTLIKSIELVRSNEYDKEVWSIATEEERTVKSLFKKTLRPPGLMIYGLYINLDEFSKLVDYIYTGDKIIRKAKVNIEFIDSEKVYYFNSNREAADFVDTVRLHGKLLEVRID
jgi:hypothetical protein